MSSISFLKKTFFQHPMKKWMFGWIFFIALFLFLAGCGKDQTTENTEETDSTLDPETGCDLEYAPICGEDGLTYQNTCFSSLRNVAAVHTGVCEYTLCSFNGQPHYILNNVLYYEDNMTRPYINVLYGTFRLQEDKDGWTYIRAINKESSYYSNRMLEYEAMVTESGNTITCETTTEIPDDLKEFLKTHGKILELEIKE